VGVRPGSTAGDYERRTESAPAAKEKALANLRITIAKWKTDLTSKDGQQLIRQMEQVGVPFLLHLPGFVRCQIIVPDAHTTGHLEEWESGDQCTAGTQALMRWVQDSGLAQHLDGQPQSYDGTIRVAS